MKTLTADKQPTQAELARIEMKCTAVEVCDVLEITEEQLNNMQFEAAYEWLEKQGCDYTMQQNFTSQPEFWGFWKKAWYEIDREFLHAHYQYWLNNPMQWYLVYHNVCGRNMNSDVINAQYHSLIKTLAVKR